MLILAVLHIISDEADPAGSVARLRAAMAPGSYLVISHADVSPAHVVGTRQLSRAVRELEEAVRSLESVPARTRDQIAGLFGDFTLVEPGLTDIWGWRPDGATARTTSDFMRILGEVARKDLVSPRGHLQILLATSSRPKRMVSAAHVPFSSGTPT